MKLFFASDHAGFQLKNELVSYLKDIYDVVDCGAHEYNESDDFTTWIPKAIESLLESVSKGESAKAIILGGSGEGEAMGANRYQGIRATAYYGGEARILELSEEHNNANVLSLGARFISFEEAKKAVDTWLAATFKGDEKYQRRNDALDQLP